MPMTRPPRPLRARRRRRGRCQRRGNSTRPWRAASGRGGEVGGGRRERPGRRGEVDASISGAPPVVASKHGDSRTPRKLVAPWPPSPGGAWRRDTRALMLDGETTATHPAEVDEDGGAPPELTWCRCVCEGGTSGCSAFRWDKVSYGDPSHGTRGVTRRRRMKTARSPGGLLSFPLFFPLYFVLTLIVIG